VAGAAGGDDTAGSSRRFRGVAPAMGGRFSAAITYAKCVRPLGLFDTAEAAAAAYDAKAVSLLGPEGALRKLNFPERAAEYAAAVLAPPAALASLAEEGEDPAPAPAPAAAAAAEEAEEEEEEDLEALLAGAAAAMRFSLAPPAARPAAARPAPPASGGPHGWRPGCALPPPLSLRASLPASAALPAAAPAQSDPTLLARPPLAAAAAARRAARRAPGAAGGAGPAWFGLGAPELTEEVKRDLRLLRLRGAADPKRFYKKADGGALPKHFAVGTVVEGAQEFYSARLAKGERRGTLAEEFAADGDGAAYRKRKFAELQGPPRGAGKGRGGGTGGRGKGRGGGAQRAHRHAQRRGQL